MFQKTRGNIASLARSSIHTLRLKNVLGWPYEGYSSQTVRRDARRAHIFSSYYATIIILHRFVLYFSHLFIFILCADVTDLIISLINVKREKGTKMFTFAGNVYKIEVVKLMYKFIACVRWRL